MTTAMPSPVWGPQALQDKSKMMEHHADDVFFTEEDYEMFSLSRTHNIRTVSQRNVKPVRPWRDIIAMREKQARVQCKQPAESPSNKKQAKPTLKSSLATANPRLSYPTYSRLTLGQHKRFQELQDKFGSKGSRVTSSQESAEHQQWRQLGGQIYKDQQDFNAFAEFAAQKYPDIYAKISPAAARYIKDALMANLERVESLPRHYTVLQTVTLNPGVPLPSDPSLQIIGSPIYLGQIPNVSIPGLETSKVSVRRGIPQEETVSKHKDDVTHDYNMQKLAETHKANLILSHSTLLTLVDNHAPLYQHPWEIPIEVKVVNPDSAQSQRLVLMRKPLMKPLYYSYEANEIYHKFALKRILTSEESKMKYGWFSDTTEETLESRDRSMEAEIENAQENPEEAFIPGNEFEELGSSGLWELETFGSQSSALKERVDDVDTEDRQEDKQLHCTEEMHVLTEPPTGSFMEGQEVVKRSVDEGCPQMFQTSPESPTVVEPATPAVPSVAEEGALCDDDRMKEPPVTSGGGDCTLESQEQPVVTSGGSDCTLESQEQPPVTSGGGDHTLECQKQPSVKSGGGDHTPESQEQPPVTSGGGDHTLECQEQQSVTSGGGDHTLESQEQPLVTSGDGDHTLESRDTREQPPANDEVGILRVKRGSSSSVSDGAETKLQESCENMGTDGEVTKGRKNEDEHPIAKELSKDCEQKVLAASIEQRPERIKFFSESSSDDEKSLMIVTDSDKPESSGEMEKSNLDHRQGIGGDNDMKYSQSEKRTPSSDVGEEVKSRETKEGEVMERAGATITKESDMSGGDNFITEEKIEEPAERMVARRSARIKNQSCSDWQSLADKNVVPRKKRKGRQTQPCSSGDENGSGALTDGKEEMKETDKGVQNIDGMTKMSEEECIGDSASDTKADDKTETQTSTPERGHGKCLRSRKESKDTGPVHITDIKKRDTESEWACLVDKQRRKILQKECAIKEGDQQKKEAESDGGPSSSDGTDHHKVQSKRLMSQSLHDKGRVQTQHRKKIPKSDVKKGVVESTIDEIMRLQERMLSRQKSSAIPQAQDQRKGQDQSQGQDQSHHQGQPLGHAIDGQHTVVEGMQTTGGVHPDGVDLKDPPEGNCAYSLWKFGRLRLLIECNNHGVLREEQDGQFKHQIVSILSKMEYQSDFGLEMQTASELTRMWLSMYLRPASKVIRGRIDSKTSEILSWESLDNTALVPSQQIFNPGMCMKMLYHILTTLAGLSEGRYLLRHRPGDAHVCVYQCMEQAALNMRASYDLHAAHQGSELVLSRPPTIPWTPLDPSAPYSKDRWEGRVPLTFPPCPPNFKPSSQPGGKQKQKRKRKKKKK